MKRFIIASLLTTVWVGVQAETYTDNARVRSAEPQYENIQVPRNECTNYWVDERHSRFEDQPRERSYGGAIVGGLAGGVLGNQVGGGSGKDAATVLGVVLGAMAGDKIDNRDVRADNNARYNRHERDQREVTRCRTVYDTQTRITGYRVAYEYRGQHYSTVMRTNPGDRIAVRVTVDPIER